MIKKQSQLVSGNTPVIVTTVIGQSPSASNIGQNTSALMNYSNVIGTSTGTKFTKGISTDIIAYKFFVNKKISLSELKTEEIIPEFITIDNHTYVTDVVEVRDILTLGCYDWFYDQTDLDLTSEQQQHRVSVRPLAGGTSVLNYDDLSNTAGTLGLIATDLTDNSVVGVSNAHVFCQYNSNNQTKKALGIVYNTCNKKTCQPAPLDVAFQSSHDIGVVKRFYPLQNNVKIDAAITHIKNTINISTNQLNMTTNNLPWATDTEIAGLISNNILLSKSSRTTGTIGGVVGCSVKAVDLNLSVVVGGYDSFLSVYQFTDCIGITYSDYGPGVSVGGDSGSAVIGTFAGGINKVIGLLFAGGSSTDYSNSASNWGIVCKITNVANLLDIGPLNPDSITYSNPSNWTYKSSASTSAETIDSIVLGGKKYWQIGNGYI